MHWGAVVFDLDGVLVDSRLGIATCIDGALRAHGLDPLPPGTVGRYIGPPLHESFAKILDERDADPTLADDCVTEFRARYRDACVHGTVLQPGMEPVVRQVAAAGPLAVATSKPLEFARAILDHLGMSECFASVAGPALDGPEVETKTETLRRALDGLPRPPDRAAMVGDRHHDVDAGRALGLVTIGVTWGYGSPAELRDADHVVDTPAELAALLGAQPAAATG